MLIHKNLNKFRPLAVLVAIFLSWILLSGFASAPVINWGLKPNERELTPTVSTAGRELLEKYNGLYVARGAANGDKKYYLTFDLGYESGNTAAVLDILKEHNLKAIFFLCGNYLKETELVNRMLAEGHTLGNHTNRHKNLPKLSEEGIRKDISVLAEDFAEKYLDAKPMAFFRPPEGSFDERTLKIAQEYGLRTMMWSIAIVDWGKKPINAGNSSDKIAKRIHPGAIILSHIANSGTPEMLKLLIPALAEKGYTCGTPDEL